jgi:hypothetical protein
MFLSALVHCSLEEMLLPTALHFFQGAVELG